MNSLHTKLLALQKSIKAIKKDATNPFFKSKYFDINSLIEEVKPLINEIGLVITQPLGVIDGKNVLQTIVLDPESGEVSNSAIALPDGLKPQELGSAITYFRRYSLQSMLFLQAEDDDANSTNPEKISVRAYHAQLPPDMKSQRAKKVVPIQGEESPF